ncbi:MAG: DUF2752 domain-containing protein [Thermoanaerobaculia bacterium]
MARLPDTDPRHGPRPRRELVLWGAAGILLVAFFVALGFWDAAAHPGPDLCLFHRATGVACPACGLTRAAAALARGEFAASFRLHPALLVVAAEVGIAWLLWGERLLTGRRRFAGSSTVVLLATAGGLVLLWLVRWALGILPS